MLKGFKYGGVLLTNNTKIRGYLLFLFSLLIMGIGISLVAKIGLGTSAISSVAYVLSLIFPLSFGTFIFITNIIFVFVQRLILKDRFEKKEYIQLLVGPLLGLFIDLGMFIFKDLSPTYYYMKLLLLILACFIIAFSIFLQLLSKVAINPGEGMVRAIHMKWNLEFWKSKIFFDSSLVIIASLLSYVFLKKIYGVREGTLITAVLVGVFLRIIESVYEKRIGKI